MTLQAAEFSLQPGNGRLSALRRKIGWICHAIRALVVFYALFSLAGLIHAYATRQPKELGNLEAVVGIDFSGASQGQWNEVLGISLPLWLLIAALCFSIFQVFTIYARGEVFSTQAATWLRYAGLLALVTIAADFFWRSGVIMILAAHLGDAVHSHHLVVETLDVFHIAVALIVLALAHVQKTAAEIVDDHAQIV